MGKVVGEIVAAVAAAEGVAPAELDYTLQDHIDAGAVDTLLNHPDSTWTLSFDVPNHTVTVTNDGVVLVDGDSTEHALPA